MGTSVVSDRPLPMADAVLVDRVARRAGGLVA